VAARRRNQIEATGKRPPRISRIPLGRQEGRSINLRPAEWIRFRAAPQEQRVARAQLRAELAGRFPLDAKIMICQGREIVRLMYQNHFADAIRANGGRQRPGSGDFDSR
jgi:hypothetical protein